MELRRVKIQKTSRNQFLEVFCTTQVDKSQTKNLARKDVNGTDFRSDSSAFLFKYDRVIFHASKLAALCMKAVICLMGASSTDLHDARRERRRS